MIRLLSRRIASSRSLLTRRSVHRRSVPRKSDHRRSVRRRSPWVHLIPRHRVGRERLRGDEPAEYGVPGTRGRRNTQGAQSARDRQGHAARLQAVRTTRAVIFNPSLNLPAIAIAQQSKDNNNGALQQSGGVATQGPDLTVAPGRRRSLPRPFRRADPSRSGPGPSRTSATSAPCRSPTRVKAVISLLTTRSTSRPTTPSASAIRRIGSAGDVPAALAAGASVSAGPSTVTIPSNTAPGDVLPVHRR